MILPAWIYNLIAVVVPLALIAFAGAFIMMIYSLLKLSGSSKDNILGYPTKGYTPLATLFNEKVLAEMKVSFYFQVSRVLGIPLWFSFSPFQKITLTDKGLIFTKAHWYYGSSTTNSHTSATEYHFFSKEDYNSVKPEFRSWRQGQVYFYVSKLSVTSNSMVLHSKRDNTPELIKRVKIKDKDFLSKAHTVSKSFNLS